MPLIQETFVETDWEEPAEAREARDQRAAQLEAQGWLCQCSTLYRITDGRRVFFLEAREPEQIDVSDVRPRKKITPRQPRPAGEKRPRDFEVR
ncbi:MAG: hypothetical protein ICV62_02015 [Cyanobacteria bacterium Co-bin13]|nr:hypothetical protein [Cyanobacteria bacterium Co-bin13]